MVLHVDPRAKSVSVVSIPRDTLVVIPGVRLDKINHAYAFGGPELATSTTSSFLGIPINYYIKININGLEKIIDEVGGVEVDVDQRMYYVDYAGDLFIDLKPGLQRLNGRDAIGFLRFRHDALGDIGRIKRQQKFLQDLAAQIASSKNPIQVYNLISDMIESVDTNLTTSQIFSLASIVRQAYEFGSVYVTALPGTSTKIDGIFYLQPDMERVKETVSRYLKNRSADADQQPGGN
jgi:LCP family protein required for cell wall assembly